MYKFKNGMNIALADFSFRCLLVRYLILDILRGIKEIEGIRGTPKSLKVLILKEHKGQKLLKSFP